MRDAASGSPAFGTAAAFGPAAAFGTAAIAADAVALAELDGGTGREEVRIGWLRRRLADAPGSRHVDEAGNLVWTFGPGPYRLALLAHVDDVFTVGEEGLGGLRGARHACHELAPVLALEGHGADRVFTEAVGSLRVRFTVTGPGGHSWWDRGRPSAVHALVGLLHATTGTAPAPLSVNVGLIHGGTGVNAIALGCCEGADMHAPTERIRADSIGAGAGQLRAVLAEIMERKP